MQVTETRLDGVRLISSPVFRDHRGSFQRLHCDAQFAALGVTLHWVQSNLSANVAANTLRGMHFQKPPHAEDKLVRCVHGAILDVALDLRADSPTFGQHFSVQLDARHGQALLIPKGCAHGYLTLTDDAIVLYHTSFPYTPQAESGVRWNDPRFDIPWPTDEPIVSDKDAAWPLWSPTP